MLSFSSGLSFYAHTIYLQALSQQSEFSLSLASSAVSLFFLSSGISGLVLAPLLQKYDVRIIVIVGAVIAAISLWLLGLVENTDRKSVV